MYVDGDGTKASGIQTMPAAETAQALIYSSSSRILLAQSLSGSRTDKLPVSHPDQPLPPPAAADSMMSLVRFRAL